MNTLSCYGSWICTGLWVCAGLGFGKVRQKPWKNYDVWFSECCGGWVSECCDVWVSGMLGKCGVRGNHEDYGEGLKWLDFGVLEGLSSLGLGDDGLGFMNG